MLIFMFNLLHWCIMLIKRLFTERILGFMNRLFTLTALLLLVLPAQAEIYKRVDVDGRITYSNVKTDNSVRLKIGQVAPKKVTPNQPQAATKQTSPSRHTTKKQANYSKVSQYTQRRRDETRRSILLDELDVEKQALIEAKNALTTGKSNPEVYRRRNADGSYSTFRNVPKYRAKVEKLQSELAMHQRNVELLEKEINALN